MRTEPYDLTWYDDAQGYVFPTAPQTPSDTRRRVPGNFSLGMLLNKAICAGAARSRGDASRSERRRAFRRTTKCGAERPGVMTQRPAALRPDVVSLSALLPAVTNLIRRCNAQQLPYMFHLMPRRLHSHAALPPLPSPLTPSHPASCIRPNIAPMPSDIPALYA